MYININKSCDGKTPVDTGLSGFRPVPAAKELAEFYPPPYDFLAPTGAGYGDGVGCSGLGACGCKDCGAGLSGWLDDLEASTGVPLWLLGVGAGIGALILLNSGSKKSELSRARLDYEKRVHDIKERHSVRGRARQAKALVPKPSVSFG